MPLGRGIVELWDAVRERVELSGHGPTWEVTAGSFDSALAYARERFEEPVVLGRTDRNRFWPRVTLTVTTDPALSASAPPLEELEQVTIPTQVARRPVAETGSSRSEAPRTAADPEAGEAAEPPRGSGLPSSLEAIFAHQEERRLARQRTPDHDSV